MVKTVKHKVGTYNVEYGHPVKDHVEMIMTRFENRQLDILCLTEVADYVQALSVAAKKAGHQVLWVKGANNVMNQAILVRKGLVVGEVYSVDTKAIYFAPNGDTRHSMCPVVAHIDGVLYVVVHAPVGAWQAGRNGRRWTGPIRRRLAYRKYMTRLARIFKRHKHIPVNMIGDWNDSPEKTGVYSPRWLADKVDGRIIRPHASTGHGEIDFAVARDMHGSLEVVPNNPKLPKSDHLLVDGDFQTHQPAA